jgi:uncharacterized protein (TIGR00730 family)
MDQNKIPKMLPASQEEPFFLEGPKSRFKELVFACNVFLEFIQGFRALHFAGPCVTVFGSARYPETHPYYKLARETGAALAAMGFTVMTGGGPGIMEAANRGALEAGGLSVGAKILLPFEQVPNRFMHAFASFRYFFVRKFLLFKYSYAFVVLPGGVGTMDELFEALTLIQTKKIKNFPVVLIGRAYFEPLMEMMRHMAREKSIDQEDLELMLVTDSIQEALLHIKKFAVDKFGLKTPAARRILGESRPRHIRQRV